MGDFRKISLGPPFALFSENADLGRRCKNCNNLAIRALFEPLFAPNSSPVIVL